MRQEVSYGLLAPALHADPAPILARARREAPVHWDPSLGTWVLSRWAEVSAVLRDPAFSVDRGGSVAGLGAHEYAAELAWCSEFVLRWMVFSDPPRHSRVRAAVHRYFAGSQMAALRPQVERAVDEALAPLRRRGRIEVLGELAVPVPARITAELLGLPIEDAELLKRWTADMFELFGAGVASAPVILAAHRSIAACRDYFAAQLAIRRKRPGDDVISALVTSADAAALDDDERIGLCATLVAGAYETTTHVVGNGLWALLRFPDQLARLRAEPGLAGNAVEETFRYDTPAFAVMRRATADVTIGGAHVAAGDKIYCLLYSANRDPARFAEPDVFDIARDDTKHLGLGHGIHFCLGAALSRLEATVMLGALAALPGLELDRDALGGGPPTYAANLAIRGLHALPVRFDPH
jgi:pimeloyl-[acyl-carrier protein] synthase